MSVSVRRIGFTAGAAALALALAGVGFVGGEHLSAQGRGGRFGGPGGPGAPGMGRRGPGGPGAMGPGGASNIGAMIGRLDLSQDQRDRVKQIMDSHKDEQKALADRAIAAREALEDAITGTTFDESLVRTRAEAVSAVDVDQTLFHARIYSEVFQILTADQQNKLKTLQTERKARREQMKAGRAGRAGQAGQAGQAG